MSFKQSQFPNICSNNKIIPNRTNSKIAIVYHYVLQVQWISLIISCSNAMSIPFICCKAILVTKDFNLACSHTIYDTITVTTNDIKAVTKEICLLYNY